MVKWLVEIWNSFRALPLWVQLWVGLVLVPVNAASLLFVFEPFGLWIAFLANVAMLANLPVLVYSRGFSNLMAFPHLVPWTILVLWLIFAPPQASGLYEYYLWLLLAVDLVSLAFDYTDTAKWLRGEREVVGK